MPASRMRRTTLARPCALVMPTVGWPSESSSRRLTRKSVFARSMCRCAHGQAVADVGAALVDDVGDEALELHLVLRGGEQAAQRADVGAVVHDREAIVIAQQVHQAAAPRGARSRSSRPTSSRSDRSPPRGSPAPASRPARRPRSPRASRRRRWCQAPGRGARAAPSARASPGCSTGTGVTGGGGGASPPVWAAGGGVGAARRTRRGRPTTTARRRRTAAATEECARPVHGRLETAPDREPICSVVHSRKTTKNRAVPTPRRRRPWRTRRAGQDASTQPSTPANSRSVHGQRRAAPDPGRGPLHLARRPDRLRAGPGRHGPGAHPGGHAPAPRGGGQGAAARAHRRAQPHRPAAGEPLRARGAGAGPLEHPGVVPVYELGRRADGTPYYSMRRIRGRSLAAERWSTASRSTSASRCSRTSSTWCRPWATRTASGVVHRDLKPENVMVSRFGETQVIDWGLAVVGRRADRRRACWRALPRTWRPSRRPASSVDARSDVWALGVMLYELLTGQAALRGRGADADPRRGADRAAFPHVQGARAPRARRR